MIPKIKIKNILYATDLSENALYAFGYAVSLADTYGAKLTLLHVILEVPNLESKVLGYVNQSQWDAIKSRHMDEARQALIGKQRDHGKIRDLLEQFSENTKAESGFEPDQIIIRKGNPEEEILAQAKEDGSDMIVLGSHGHGTLVDAMMGNTVRRVLRRSTVPVLTIRQPK